MLGVIGDLVTDVVVRNVGDIAYGTDTTTEVTHRRGGSAANLAVAAAKLGADTAFFGNVGIDERGTELVLELEAKGVKALVTRLGVTGTVVALIDKTGERTMLTDRKAAKDFALSNDELAELLEGVGELDFLHIPAYSLVVEPLATTATLLAAIAKRVSIGVSSVAAVSDFGIDKFWELVQKINPTLVVCNKAEADLLGERLMPSTDKGVDFTTVVTQGANSTLIYTQSQVKEVAQSSDILAQDTTGAGDAFTAGLLVGLLADIKSAKELQMSNIQQAVELGHKTAVDLLTEHNQQK